VLVGFLDRYHTTTLEFAFTSPARRECLTLVGTNPDASAWMARGATLDPDDALDFALAHLPATTTNTSAP
jgi:hypothetical protein